MKTQYITELPEDWKPIARIFSALGDETRQIIMLLFEPGEELGLKAIVDALPLSRTAVVHHLGVLERAGLLIPRKQKREMYYSVALEGIIEALDMVKTYAENELREVQAKQQKSTGQESLDL